MIWSFRRSPAVVSGNLYQPDGNTASFASVTFNQAQMAKETNEDATDFSDVQALYDLMQDNTRTTDPAAWRTKLDKSLNTDAYLNYLTV